MIKERIKRLGCFVLAVCMIMCSQMPVMAKEIKMQGNINSMNCKAPEISSMVVKLSDGTKESLGNVYTTDSSSGAYIKKDKTKRLINTLAYYYSNATSDDDLMSHFKIVFEKSKYYLEADEVVDAPDAGMYEDVDKQDSYTNYYGFSKSEVKNDKLNYLKQIFSCTRFRRSDLRMYSKDGSIYSYLLSKNTSKDIYCYEDNNKNSYVKVGDVIDGFDLKYESYSSSYYGGTINVSMTSNDKLIAGQIESTIVVRDDGSAVPVITNTKEELKKIVLDKNSVNEVYNQKFDNRNDIPDENCLKAGDILYKNVPYIISNYKLNKTEDQTWLPDKISVYTSDFSGGSGSSMSFVDAKTKKEIDRASFYTSNSVIQTELFLQPKTYAVKSVEYDNGYYRVMLGCAHEDVTTTTEPVLDATCTTKGAYIEIKTCADCGEELSRTAHTTKALGHVKGTAVKENVVNPACETEGSYDEVIYCERDENGCNHSKLSSTHVTVPATGHLHQATRIEKTKEPTCTEKGLYKSVTYCTDCNKVLDTKDIEIPATGHTAGEVQKENVKDATCENKGGYDDVTRCTKCNAIISKNAVKTEALGHIAGEPVIENKADPTTKKEGGYDIVVYCTRDEHGCGHKELSRKHVVMDKLKHEHTAGEPVIEVVKAATCEDKGSVKVTVSCTDCGEVLSSVTKDIPALGHNYEFTKTVAATCTKDGYNLYTCKNDASHTKKDVIKASGHKYTHKTDSYTEPTCTENGKYREYDECVNCGDVVNEEWKSVDALGHEAGEPIIENKVDPTTEKEGGYDIVVYCTRKHNGCGKSEISRKHIILDKLKHEHTVGKPVVENKIDATCTKGGSYDVNVYCTDCNKLLNSTHETTEALGHEYSEPVVENKDGDKYDEVIYCARCGAELSRRTIDNSKKEPVVPDNKPEAKPETKPETVNVVIPQDVETKVDDTVKTDNDSSADSTEEKTPVTGDTTDIMMYVYIIIVGAVAVTSAVIKKNKRA